MKCCAASVSCGKEINDGQDRGQPLWRPWLPSVATMRSLFSRIPAVVWSGLLAFVLTAGAGGIWSALLVSNLRTSLAIPWAVGVMALLLWLLWQYLGGRWGPRRTANARRRSLRARPLPGPVFAWAVGAGLLAIVALAGG